MKEKYYQMKDIVEKFMISRDMIKYYEKKGLISPVRNDAGYRLYSETDVQKIKFILDVKDLGFALDDVETQLESFENVLKSVQKIREEKEQEIIKLNQQLKKICNYEQWLLDNKMYRDTFKICYDFKICIGCERIELREIDSFYVRDMEILHLSDDYEVEDSKDNLAVLTKEVMQVHKKCERCQESKILTFPKVYRGTWVNEERGDFGFLKSVYEKAEELGYELKKEIYCSKRITKKTGVYGLLLDMCIPFEE